jgi:hypothetical protein
LDALFAERVLEKPVMWTIAHDSPADTTEERLPVMISAVGEPFVMPPYTRSLDAAWEGAGKMGWVEVSGPFKGRDGIYDALVERPGANADDCGRSNAAHPAEALVLACLRAVGVDESELV